MIPSFNDGGYLPPGRPPFFGHCARAQPQAIDQYVNRIFGNDRFGAPKGVIEVTE